MVNDKPSEWHPGIITKCGMGLNSKEVTDTPVAGITDFNARVINCSCNEGSRQQGEQSHIKNKACILEIHKSINRLSMMALCVRIYTKYQEIKFCMKYVMFYFMVLKKLLDLNLVH